MTGHFIRATVALVQDTFREAMARKIFWGLFAISALMIAFFLFLLKIDVVAGATATVSLFGSSIDRRTDLGRVVVMVHASIATFLYGFGMFLAVFASAGLTPSLLESGRIELLLSKPVARWHLLLSRYLGNILIIFLNSSFLVTGVWLIFGLKTGIWSASFLWTIATTVFLFAVLLTVVVLAGVLFESAALATMVTVALMILSPILAQTQMMERLLSSESSRQVWRGLYYVLPKAHDLGRMTLEIVQGKAVTDLMPLWSSAIFGLVVLSIAVFFFHRRDY